VTPKKNKKTMCNNSHCSKIKYRVYLYLELQNYYLNIAEIVGKKFNQIVCLELRSDKRYVTIIKKNFWMTRNISMIF